MNTPVDNNAAEVDLNETTVDATAIEAPPPEPANDETEGTMVSFSFARRHGVVVTTNDDGSLKAVVKKGASPSALSEVRRLAGFNMWGALGFYDDRI